MFAFQNQNLSACLLISKIRIASAKSKMFIWEILIEQDKQMSGERILSDTVALLV